MIKRQSKGFTLTEIAIVLAIVGLILGAIWVAAKSVMDSSRSNQAVQDIATMSTNMRSIFAAQTQFTLAGDQTAAMIASGVIPNNLLTSGGVTASNSWGGSVIITLQSTDSRHFRIAYKGTPFDACFKIASQLSNIGTSDAPVNLITNTTNVVAIANSGSTVGLSTDAINTACKLNETGGVVNATASTEFDYTIH